MVQICLEKLPVQVQQHFCTVRMPSAALAHPPSHEHYTACHMSMGNVLLGFAAYATHSGLPLITGTSAGLELVTSTLTSPKMAGKRAHAVVGVHHYVTRSTKARRWVLGMHGYLPSTSGLGSSWLAGQGSGARGRSVYVWDPCRLACAHGRLAPALARIA